MVRGVSLLAVFELGVRFEVVETGMDLFVRASTCLTPGRLLKDLRNFTTCSGVEGACNCYAGYLVVDVLSDANVCVLVLDCGLLARLAQEGLPG